MKKSYRLLLQVILPLVAGGLTYVLFRTDSLKMFHWFDQMGLSEFITSARVLASSFVPPDWFLYNLPDALWLFSFTSMMLLIWGNKFTLHTILWITIAPAMGILSEIGQAIKLIPGTFDSLDLIFLLLATALSFASAFNTRTTKSI